MSTGYIFKAGKEQAISNKKDGSNLPPPKNGGTWVFSKERERAEDLIATDEEAFAKDGFHIVPPR